VRHDVCGDYWWLSDAQGYRYAEAHPNGKPWPANPLGYPYESGMNLTDWSASRILAVNYYRVGC